MDERKRIIEQAGNGLASGISKRDFFAAFALAGLLAHGTTSTNVESAYAAYSIAECMVEMSATGDIKEDD